jgi:uncharacterized protein YkwD
MSGQRFGSKALLAALACASLLLATLAAPPRARAEAYADPLADVQLLRGSGCGGLEPAEGALRHVDVLDRVAAQWASGRSLSTAARRAGYAAQKLAAVRVAGSDDAILQALRRTSCLNIMQRALTDVGIYAQGRDAWLVLAPSSYVAPRHVAPNALAPSYLAPSSVAPSYSAPSYSAPDDMRSPSFAARVLELVNAVRARGTACGVRAFAPTGPVRLSTVLAQVAYGHALDMAEHDYFEHQDLTGHTPADRVRAAGYRENLVGENIAYGPVSPEEVVRGWLDSPGHCENIMDPRFAEMGVAFARGRAPVPASGVGLYWVQVLADPKS